MCGTCGCGQPDEAVKIRKPGDEQHTHSYSHHHIHSHDGDHHEHDHDHSYSHSHDHDDVKHVHNHKHHHMHHEHDHNHDHGCGDDCGCGHDHEHKYENQSDHDCGCGDDCGCNHDHDYDHHHEHDHHDHDHYHHDHDHHHHNHDHSHGGRQIEIAQNALFQNDLIAQQNRGYFEGRGLLALNLVSSPGSGKTSLLEKTIKLLKDSTNIFVIEGDQQTMNDANRIYAAGAPVVQVNTGNGCHLDADMVSRAIKKLDIHGEGILMIENVGNLVCPSLFDLGEARRVVIISVTEGDDKPLKYPTMFETSDICIINKIDLLPYVDFDVAKAREYALRVNPKLQFFEMSVKTEEGMKPWIEWLLNMQKEIQ